MTLGEWTCATGEIVRVSRQLSTIMVEILEDDNIVTVVCIEGDEEFYSSFHIGEVITVNGNYREERGIAVRYFYCTASTG